MSGPRVAAGEWWRLFTATWLHGDAAHLASNAALGLILIGLTMGRYGPATGLLAAYVAGIGGNLAVFALWHGQGSLGASGVVMGSLGLLAAYSVSPGLIQGKKLVVGSLLGAFMLFVLIGLNPETDWRAHIGGFVSGVLLGGLMGAFGRAHSERLWNGIAAALFTAAVVIPWLMAIRAFGR